MAAPPPLSQRCRQQLKDALRAGDSLRAGTLRMTLAELHEKELRLRAGGEKRDLAQKEEWALVQDMVKRRRESAALYEKGGREELAATEKKEITILEAFLPPQLSPQESRDAVREALKATGAKSMGDMGKVMAWLRQRHAGAMDFAAAGQQARALLKG